MPYGHDQNICLLNFERVGLVGAGHALHIDPDQAQFAQVCFLQQLHNGFNVAAAVGVLVHKITPSRRTLPAVFPAIRDGKKILAVSAGLFDAACDGRGDVLKALRRPAARNDGDFPAAAPGVDDL